MPLGCHVPPDRMWQEKDFNLVVIFPKTCNPSPTMRKSQTNPVWGAFFNIPHGIPQNRQGHEKQKRQRKCHRPEEAKGHRHLMWCRSGSWNRKRTVMEKLVIPIKSRVQVRVTYQHSPLSVDKCTPAMGDARCCHQAELGLPKPLQGLSLFSLCSFCKSTMGLNKKLYLKTQSKP